MELIEIKKQVKDYLHRSFHLDSLDEAENIFETGGINSLFYIQLLVFIEKTFAIHLEEDEFDISKLTNVNDISAMLFNKLSAS